ncbi:hypothetical protein [Mycoplasmopsis bovis]|uniref:Uncharacterized protein n=2 Tax=Mycoplasmopsis bovis TaxID=28903 RepID=A0ABY8RWS5_MYCBV|nr:hypothetical protein [Mycoplasmopsis bovis]MBT1315981.1 hypothetical protein [Mycoplasmopsis bovis]MBT1317323.1 hypothetical protein [Mycoplasmopsis bovis]MBT1368162.1 hypothetical protein [Mycoplasmopsis bovis]MBT1368881.1 hypothetical protein [Mycoplasmopsis bovis]MBT1393729.1 hypothetical protein [Mycoplasmopsis bovis]
MSNDFETLLTIKNDKEVKKEFYKLLEQKINRANFLKIVQQDRSKNWVASEVDKVKQKAYSFIPESSYSMQQFYRSGHKKGSLKDLIISSVENTSLGIKAYVGVNNDLIAKDGSYYSVLAGYRYKSSKRKQASREKITYKFSKKEAKKDPITKAYKTVEKNPNNYIRKYISEVFINGLKELNKEK